MTGGNIWGATRDLTLIGKSKSTLDALVERIAADQGRVVKGNQFPDRGTFYRSDQFNFAKIGVPAVFLNLGVDFIDREAGWGRDRLGFLLGYRLATDPELPRWLPGDEFEAARLTALEDVNARKKPGSL